MKKNTIKIILDIIMLALLLLMYDSRAVTLSFHEIGGLALFGLFVIHMALNFGWIKASGGKLLRKALPGKARLKFIIDMLLFLSIALITVSGIFISEVVFNIQGGAGWRIAHYFASAVSLILLGVHIGLNWAFIKKTIKLPRVVALPLGVILLAAILGFGGYSLVTGDFAGWLASPFTNVAFEYHGFSGGDDLTLTGEDGSGQFTFPENGQLPGSRQIAPRGSGEAPSFQFGGNGQGLDQHNGQGLGLGQGRGTSDGALLTLATYGSITGVFAVITALLDKLTKKKKRNGVDIEKAVGGEAESAV